MQTVVVRLKDTCNLKCRMCNSYTKDNVRNSQMSLEDYNIILKKLKKARIRGQKIDAIRLDGNREGLCYPHIDTAIRMAKEYGFYAHLVSNGVLLTEPISKNLLNAGLDMIAFSVAGISPETYSRFQGYEMPENQLHRVCNNIKLFSTIKKELCSLCEIYISFILDELLIQDADEPRKAITFWKTLECNYFRLVREYPLMDHKRPVGGSLCATSHIINTDGQVFPCCGGSEDIVIGNLLHDEPEDIFSGETIMKLYRGLNNPDEIALPKPCKTCVLNGMPKCHDMNFRYTENIPLENNSFKEFCKVAHNKNVYILGMNEIAAEAISDCLRAGISITGIIDNDFHNWGKLINDIPVIEPNCNNVKDDCVLLTCTRNISDAWSLAKEWGYTYIYIYNLFFEQHFQRHPMLTVSFNLN
jgi:MoaA/NifB/PqqE/SkfB family radical SAM enzyme